MPERVGRCENLVELNFTANQLVALPQDMASLTKLENLFLSSNRLETLPACVSLVSHRSAA